MNSPIEMVDGKATWVHQAGDLYLATGIDRRGQRFSIRHSEWHWVNGVNLWRGSKWLIRGGKRYKIQTTTN